MERGGGWLGVNYDLLKPQTSRTTTNKATHTHTHTCRGTITTPTRPITHSPPLHCPLDPSSFVGCATYSLLSFVSLRFVLSFFFFPFFLLLCLSVFLAFLRVSGLRSPCLRFSRQFLLYDFILSSFYAFFMLDVAVFSLCWPTNPPGTTFPVPESKQFSGCQWPNTVQYGSLLTPSLSLSLTLCLSLTLPLSK